MGRKNERIAELEFELAKVKGTNNVLEGWRNAWLASFKNEDQRITIQTTMAALTQLWELLKAYHQTDAVTKLREVIEQAKFVGRHKQRELDHNQINASLRHQITTLNLANRQLTFERDGAIEAKHVQSFDLHNATARIEELETAIRGVLGAMESGNIRVGTKEDFDTDQLAAVLGDDHAEI